MAGAFDQHKFTTGQLGERPSPVDVLADVAVAVDDQDGHPEFAASSP